MRILGQSYIFITVLIIFYLSDAAVFVNSSN